MQIFSYEGRIRIRIRGEECIGGEQRGISVHLPPLAGFYTSVYVNMNNSFHYLMIFFLQALELEGVNLNAGKPDRQQTSPPVEEKQKFSLQNIFEESTK